MTVTTTSTDDQAISSIRLLAIDMVAKAKSGHPGAPMGMAPTAHVLFTRHLVADPSAPKWQNRDRIVLSNGHASALLYSLLHISGYDLSMEDLKKFRQLHSKTPGHPECFKTAVFCGDGCLQEGICAEAASLAGHLQLRNLIVLYDDNKITIDGCTDNSFTEDAGMRFKAYGWNVIAVDDADSDVDSIDSAITKAKQSARPTIIKLRTTIGFGSRVQNTHGVHGSPLATDDIAAIKARFGADPAVSFHVPDAVYQLYASTLGTRGARAHAEWNLGMAAFQQSDPAASAELTRRIAGQLPVGWKYLLPTVTTGQAVVGGRKHSENVLNALAVAIPELIGGSADLSSSNYTRVNGAEDFQAPQTGLGSYKGRYIRYGVREHAMGGIMNGLSAYGGFIPFAGTFLNFVAYAAGAVRLSALSGHQVIWVATHDSIGLGEDGPTQQPTEVAWLRAMPNLNFWRPADGNEVSAAYQTALEATSTPSVLALSRQNLPNLPNSSIAAAAKGGYIVKDIDGAAVTLIGTGSEVSIALEAAAILDSRSTKARVVSLPCWEVFKAQDKTYRSRVLPSGVLTVSVEAYSSFGWSEFSDAHVGIEGWGDSAPPAVLYEHFGLTPTKVANNVGELLVNGKA